MIDFFRDIWNDLKRTVKNEMQDLSYMEIVTGTTNKVDGYIDNDAWDILQALRNGKIPSEEPKEERNRILQSDLLTLDNVVILARTRIELDGDVFFLIKGEDGKPIAIGEEAMELHRLGIEIAVKNWKYFLDFVVDMTATIGEILGEYNLKDVQKYRKSDNNS